MIRRSGSGWKVVSHKGKALSKVLPTRKAAEARLAQVEHFKHQDQRSSTRRKRGER